MKYTRGLSIAILLLLASPGFAGMYADDMGRCLVSKTTTQDKTDLVRWIFASVTLHPEVAALAKITVKEREAINERAGKLVEKLLTDSCRYKAMDALKYEGALAFQTSFQVLGQVAMQELMTNENVKKGFGELSKYMDNSKIEALAPKPQK